jgi:hypothetical protein
MINAQDFLEFGWCLPGVQENSQVFPDFGNIDGVVKAVDTITAMQRMRNAQGFLEFWECLEVQYNCQVFPDFGKAKNDKCSRFSRIWLMLSSTGEFSSFSRLWQHW